MHIRFSSCMGIPVMIEGTDGCVGTVSGVLIHPDTGSVEGFFIHGRTILSQELLFVSSMDIVRWGTRIYIQSADAVASPEDRIRLKPLLDDVRTVLGQKIRTESGTLIGRCKDVQINTESMHIEWIFPRKLFRWGVALPVSEILEVRTDGIVVKDRLKAEAISSEESMVTGMADLSETPVAGCASDT